MEAQEGIEPSSAILQTAFRASWLSRAVGAPAQGRTAPSGLPNRRAEPRQLLGHAGGGVEPQSVFAGRREPGSRHVRFVATPRMCSLLPVDPWIGRKDSNLHSKASKARILPLEHARTRYYRDMAKRKLKKIAGCGVRAFLRERTTGDWPATPSS